MRNVGRRTILRRNQQRLARRLEQPYAASPHGAKWRRAVDLQWQSLFACCVDRQSQSRLHHLRRRLQSESRGVVESALAELELATLLRNGGYGVSFLPESRARTADLECQGQGERFFVEVTAMVGTRRGRRSAGSDVRRSSDDRNQDNEHRPDLLTTRLLARVSQKAKQLRDYAAPVLLAITLPPSDRDEGWFLGRRPAGWRNDEEVDLRRLAGALTLMLAVIPHVSAVLLSLWDKEPLRQLSSVRLANAYIVERSRRQSTSPRIRLLVLNPVATHELSGAVVETLKPML